MEETSKMIRKPASFTNLCRVHSKLVHVHKNTYQCEYCGGYIDIITSVEYDWQDVCAKMDAIFRKEGVGDGNTQSQGTNPEGTGSNVDSPGDVCTGAQSGDGTWDTTEDDRCTGEGVLD